MKSPELFRLFASEDFPGLLKLVDETVEREAVAIPTRTLLKFRISRTLHRFGIHHQVRFRVFDASSGRFLETGAYVCLFCDRP